MPQTSSSHTTRAHSAPTSIDAFRKELNRRLAAPQRHRLLQGYPMLPVMGRLEPGSDPVDGFEVDTDRTLIVGVLPHPFCNPRVAGCGFCTFPHEKFRRSEAGATVAAVAEEVERRVARRPELSGRRVDALYFGGGTANLTPPTAFTHLGETLAESFDLSGAELSFEGVPVYFLARDAALLDRFAALPARHRRLSMGVQTFDCDWLERMGRDAFGGRETIEKVVRAAHDREMTVSCDLLINLPGQRTEAMIRDIETAMGMGFDQICVYHLVLFRGIGTPWGQNDDLLDRLPGNETAFDSWRAVRDRLLENGFVQTTLTNFERRTVYETPRRFVYEDLSFQPEKTDAVGFGPGGISTFSDLSGRRAIKLVNARAARVYRNRLSGQGLAFDRSFAYQEVDLKLMHLTRRLARGQVLRKTYETVFSTDPADDFGPAVTACLEAGLIELEPDAIRLTERGNFFADSVAGLLAWPRIEAFRRQGRLPLVWGPEGEGIDPNRAMDHDMG